MSIDFPIRLTERRLVLCIIILAISVRVPLVLKPFSSGSMDIWRESDTASIAHNFYDGGNYNILYPQINWGGNGPGYVETEFQLYPFLVSLAYSVFGEHPNLGRLVSLLFSVPAFVMFYLLARRLIKPHAALWALGFLVISPIYIRFSVAFMPEATMFFFYLASLYLFTKWLDEQKLYLLLVGAVCTALAILVKPTAIHLGVIFGLLLIERYKFSFLRRGWLWIFGAISLTPGLLWFLHARNLYLNYGNTFGVISGGDSKFGGLKYWLSPNFYATLAAIDSKWVFAGIGVVIFLLGLLVYARKGQSGLILFGVGTIFGYYLILARYTEFAANYHIYAAPYASLGIGIGLAWLFEQLQVSISLKRLANTSIAAVGLCSVLLILYSTFRTYREMTKPAEQALITCAEHVEALVPEDARVIISTTSPALDNGTPNNYQEPQIFYYSHRYGWSLPSDWHTASKVNEYVLNGADYLVLYDDTLYHENFGFAAYLELNAIQIGPGRHNGCGIYRFKTAEQSS